MKKIGRYDVISELGRGAMGIVYRASDPTIGREVALKVISLNSSPEEGTNSPQQMFMREVRAAGRLAHPAIVTIHDAFDDKESQTSCIVMEMVPGKTLEKLLESGVTLSPEQTLNLVRQVAEGLDFAHRNQVIHRDLKPANILVTEDGRAKITDFGIAKVLAREGVTRTVGVMGTPSYMSPEQVKGGEVDARTDIFSLGIIIFLMLTGKKPFVGNTAAVMFQIVYEEPPVPSRLNPQLTPAYDSVVAMCLAKDRNRRYTSTRDLLADLDDIQSGRPLRSQAAASAPAASRAPAATPPMNRTLAMPVPSFVNAGSQQPSPQPAPPLAPPQHAAAPPRSPVPPSVTPVESGGTVPAPPPTGTVAMPISELMKATSQQPSPRVTPPPPVAPQASKPAAPPPVSAEKAAGPVTRPPADRTMAMPISSLMKGMSKTPAPGALSAPPAASSGPLPPPKPAVPPPVVPASGPNAPPLAGQTLKMHVPDFSAGADSVPTSREPTPIPSISDEPTQMDRTLPLRVPDLSVVSVSRPASPPKVSAPPSPHDTPLMDRTLPLRVPDLSGASMSPATIPPAISAPPVPVVTPPMDRTLPLRAPDFSEAPQASGPQPIATAPPPQTFVSPAVVSAGSPPAELRPPKSKFIPVMLSSVAVALMAVGTWGYWKFHQSRTAPPPPPQVAVQSPPALQPQTPVATPVESPTPPPATATEQAQTTPPTPTPTPSPTPAAKPAAPPVKTAPAPAKKAATHQPKASVASHPTAPAPTPPPAQPQPVVVTPAPNPSPATPSPEAVAKAEAAKFANIPRIVQVVCNYGLKEATLSFSSGGKALLEEPLKGKKVKGGFLGIKGSYQGTFTHTITVPAGTSEISIHVVAKDGAADLSKSIKMPPPGGFVPTLAVGVDADHLSANWNSSSPAK